MALAQAAKSVLVWKSPRPICYLAVTLYLRSESMGIVSAVDDAMSPPGCGRGTVSAELNFLSEKAASAYGKRGMVRNGKRFLSCFNAFPHAFAGLTSLHVESVKLGDSDIPNVLRTCQKLKRLSLLNCNYSGRGMVLVLEHPELTELELVTCNAVELKWLPKLAQVTCGDWLRSRNINDGMYSLLFGHVPLLRLLRPATNSCFACFGYPLLLPSKLLDNCATLHELHLGFESQRIWFQPEGPERLTPLLRNLTILQLSLDRVYEGCGLTWTLFLLRAAPLLKTIQIKVLSYDPNFIQNEIIRQHFICLGSNIEWEPSDFKHHSLVRLDIYGFQSDSRFMGYIRRVIVAAVNLEVIALNDQVCEHYRFHPTTTYPRTKQARDLIRKKINEGLTSPAKDVQFHEMSLKGPTKIVD